MLLAGCGQTSYFGTLSRMQAVNRMGLYIDRDGSLYPSEGPVIDKKDLDQEEGYLLAYYLDHDEDRQELLKAYRIPEQTDIEQAWPLLQHKLRLTAGQDVTKRLEELGSTATLVVLIHGFNNTADEAFASYQVAEQKMKELGLPKAPHLFLEVYWDGRFGTSVPAFFVYSQANAKFVGLALREVLGSIPAAHPVRILTHSLGAVVAANALWNVTAAMGLDSIKTTSDLQYWQQLHGHKGYLFTDAYRDSTYYRTPTHPDLRLAMLAPATPGATFTDYFQRTPQQPAQPSIYRAIIVGANATDRVLTREHSKLPLLGHTELGFDPTHFTYAQDVVKKDPSCQLIRFEMYDPANPHCKEHSWIVYTKEANRMPAFMQALLTE